WFGSPNVIFSVVILTCVWLFHRDRPTEVFTILSAWTIIVAVQPFEVLLSLRAWWYEGSPGPVPEELVGEIAAHQSPGIVLIRQLGDRQIPRGTPLIVADNNGPWMLGVALNYVGRDEGNL